MRKKLFLLSSLFLIGCSESFSNFTIDNVVKSNEKLNFSINFKNNEVLDKVKESSSKKIVCKNTANNNQMLDAYIDKIENNKIDVSVEFCSNNDNRSCEPVDISSVKKINLECQAIFSAMIGNVSKSEKFPIVWEEK
ncbi:hypothetical protein Q5M49_16395 [Acinetobacter nosocomialis]|jgi:hypothetical protein|uniref:hypothetical protein n=1 Tax=Acinetobacter TaxID=469 RepID=UPI0001B8EAE2|nr:MULTISPECIES: hypothetical protein [Acinetobacter]AJB49831.1 hypothetical protein RR32_17605 [Acinetobacter nosocomialis]EEW98275.1 hypothetical protein HMPREF0014_03365 [Acinetobacter sp. RUH 2624]MBD0442807.1 hypothetical protein [Acinetobacter nosocomialis]MBR7740164.1 hypothetical protein [Acinetobacter nosocomialis]MDO7195246.1 hypothetical protein [Acinetobacter nosocomialis]